MTGGTFWDRRRAAVEAEAQAEMRANTQAEIAAREAELAETDDAEILADLELPDPEMLGPGDDFSVFLRDVVPARIRTRALRRLWMSNPVLANVDGLLDYGDDFTDAAMAVENIQTAYQVGKGMTAHVEELARQAEENAVANQAELDAAAREAESEPLADGDATGGDASEPLASVAGGAQCMPENASEDVSAASDVPQPGTAVPDTTATDTAAARSVAQATEDEPLVQVTPRRMRFAFDGRGETA